jgi:hypothetical protein
MVFPKKNKKQPALSVRRRAGQSIRGEKERLTDNRLIPFYFSTAFLWILWVIEESKVRGHQTPQPRVWLCLAIIATGISAIVIGRLLRKFRSLNRGERGEMKVAEMLDELRAAGYQPFHDLCGDGYNIDHVLVGPAGVFAIETKFRSGYGEIEFRNGEGLFVGGYPEEKDCLKQARGNASEVNRIIKENCGLNQWVTPLVVFVGNCTIRNTWRSTHARVFTADQVARYIRERQPELKRSEITLIASHLERTVKS